MKRTALKRKTRLKTVYRSTDPELVRQLEERSGGRCEIPGCRFKAYHPHHRKMRSQSGKDELANLLHVCPSCHRFIHENPGEAYRRGYLVKSWDTVPWLP